MTACSNTKKGNCTMATGSAVAAAAWYSTPMVLQQYKLGGCIRDINNISSATHEKLQLTVQRQSGVNSNASRENAHMMGGCEHVSNQFIEKWNALLKVDMPWLAR
jgi:hypothetical protein